MGFYLGMILWPCSRPLLGLPDDIDRTSYIRYLSHGQGQSQRLFPTWTPKSIQTHYGFFGLFLEALGHGCSHIPFEVQVVWPHSSGLG